MLAIGSRLHCRLTRVIVNIDEFRACIAGSHPLSCAIMLNSRAVTSMTKFPWVDVNEYSLMPVNGFQVKDTEVQTTLTALDMDIICTTQAAALSQ